MVVMMQPSNGLIMLTRHRVAANACKPTPSDGLGHETTVYCTSLTPPTRPIRRCAQLESRASTGRRVHAVVNPCSQVYTSAPDASSSSTIFCCPRAWQPRRAGDPPAFGLQVAEAHQRPAPPASGASSCYPDLPFVLSWRSYAARIASSSLVGFTSYFSNSCMLSCLTWSWPSPTLPRCWP